MGLPPAAETRWAEAFARTPASHRHRRLGSGFCVRQILLTMRGVLAHSWQRRAVHSRQRRKGLRTARAFGPALGWASRTTAPPSDRERTLARRPPPCPEQKARAIHAAAGRIPMPLARILRLHRQWLHAAAFHPNP